MENASKALVMAGTLLISIIVINALLYMFNHLTGYQRTAQTVSTERQISEFNKEYISFEKNLYGSELLSLVNKAVDYNTKYQNDGYVPITIKLTVVTGTGLNNSTSLVKSGTYSINSKSSNVVSNALLVQIENIKTKYGGDKHLQRLVALNDSGKTNEINTLLASINPSYNYTNSRNDIMKYSEYMEFKRKKFEFVETLFDGEQPGATISETNGRVVSMEYREITT